MNININKKKIAIIGGIVVVSAIAIGLGAYFGIPSGTTSKQVALDTIVLLEDNVKGQRGKQLMKEHNMICLSDSLTDFSSFHSLYNELFNKTGSDVSKTRALSYKGEVVAEKTVEGVILDVKYTCWNVTI